MTKKHFILLANTFKGLRPDNESSEGFEMWAALVAHMADNLATTNPAFNKTTFINACIGAK